MNLLRYFIKDKYSKDYEQYTECWKCGAPVLTDGRCINCDVGPIVKMKAKYQAHKLIKEARKNR